VLISARRAARSATVQASRRLGRHQHGYLADPVLMAWRHAFKPQPGR
jgi:hypothetical protein